MHRQYLDEKDWEEESCYSSMLSELNFYLKRSLVAEKHLKIAKEDIKRLQNEEETE